MGICLLIGNTDTRRLMPEKLRTHSSPNPTLILTRGGVGVQLLRYRNRSAHAIDKGQQNLRTD